MKKTIKFFGNLSLRDEKWIAGILFVLWLITTELFSFFSSSSYDWLTHFGIHLSVLGTIIGVLNFRTLEKMKSKYSGNKSRITILSEINQLLEKLANNKTDDKTQRHYLRVKSKLKIIDEVKNDEKIQENFLQLPEGLSEDSIYDITSYMTQIGTLLESSSYLGE